MRRDGVVVPHGLFNAICNALGDGTERNEELRRYLLASDDLVRRLRGPEAGDVYCETLCAEAAERIEADARRIAELGDDCVRLNNEKMDAIEARLKAERERDEYRKDAERYRWLRQQDDDDEMLLVYLELPYRPTPENWDDAIDKVREGK